MTDVQCHGCGYVRETSEPHPTLVCCTECGSTRVEYTNRSEGCNVY